MKMQHSHIDWPDGAIRSNDYHVLPATEKQILFAQKIAKSSNIALPVDALADRQRISQWIDKHKSAVPVTRFSNYPSSKQVGFAERIARIKRRDIPHECFRDRTMMSKWIDSNL
jgi:hypothetical protein